MDVLVVCDHVRKAIGRKLILDDISLQLRASQVVALLGPNGAGKTTLLKMMAGLMLPDQGTVRVLKHSPGRNRDIHDQIGWVSGEDRSFYGRLSGLDNLRFFGAMQGLDPHQIERRLIELESAFKLEDVLRTPYLKCSSGMRQKLAIVRALLHRPRIMLLDEPTKSLDSTHARLMRKWVQTWVRNLTAVAVWATHDVQEAFEIADRIVMLQDGKVILNESKSALVSAYKESTPAQIYAKYIREK